MANQNYSTRTLRTSIIKLKIGQKKHYFNNKTHRNNIVEYFSARNKNEQSFE